MTELGYKEKIAITAISIIALLAVVFVVSNFMDDPGDPTDVLPNYTVTGETDLEGNIYLSFVYTKNIIMLDGKGNLVWFKHGESPENGVNTGYWDFKKHVIDGKVYYSYHDQDSTQDKYGLEGYAPGERVILDSNFKEIKRITFEESDTVYKGHPLDGHDFYLFDLDHYIMSGYIKERVYNVPGYEETGSNVIYSYLQEVKDGVVLWDWKSIDYPELYSLTVTDATPTANDFANEKVDAPDYVHFNAMRVNDDGDLICSFRHLNTILCLDRTTQTNQIKWKLSGNADEFGLTDDQKTSSQHYVTVDGTSIMAFDNHNSTEKTRVFWCDLDYDSMAVKEYESYRIDGKFTSACGSAQRIHDNVFALGWGKAENDKVCFCIYDFDKDEELLRITLDNMENFTYRCVYYE